MIYCRKGTVVIEMNIPMEGGRQCFAYVAYNLGLRYHRYGIDPQMYTSYTPGKNFYYSSSAVNVSAFLDFLSNVLKENGLLQAEDKDKDLTDGR